jgi:hypothetical protein
VVLDVRLAKFQTHHLDRRSSRGWTRSCWRRVRILVARRFIAGISSRWSVRAVQVRIAALSAPHEIPYQSIPSLPATTSCSVNEDIAEAAETRQDIRPQLFPPHIAPALVFPTTSNPHHPADGDWREIPPCGAPVS